MFCLMDTQRGTVTSPRASSPLVNACRFLAFAGSLIAASLALANAPIPAADRHPPPARAEKPKDIQSATQSAPDKLREYKIRGHCIDQSDRSPVAGVRVLLFEAAGRTLPIAQIAETTTDAKGEFEFPNLNSPRDVDGLDRLEYQVFAVDPNWAIGTASFGFRRKIPWATIRLSREEGTLSGKVVNSQGQPVAGATVATFSIDGRVLPGILSTTTGRDGRFTIDKLPVIRARSGAQSPVTFQVLHRDYPETPGHVAELPADVTVALPDGCTVTGRVVDAVTGKPTPNSLVTGERLWYQGRHERWPIDRHGTFALSDSAGRFRMVLAEDHYNFLVEGPDRVGVALTNRERLGGESVELPPFKLVAGGLISGRVLIASTHQPVPRSTNGTPILLGLFGPSHPSDPLNVVPARLSSVDAEGRFTLRAVPGENFPYLVNETGDRMAGNTRQQPPVIVKEGRTTEYDMLITPPADKAKAARALVAALPQAPAARTALLLAEFDKQKSPEEEPERWCTLMQELVTIGPAAVPQICEELDRTNQQVVLQRLCFALRAIGDPRAVPALIRAIPKNVRPRSGKVVVRVDDAKLAEFLRRHSLKDGETLGCERPVRELFGALHALTRQDFNDEEVERVVLGRGRRGQDLERRASFRQARLWQTWWEANWKKFTQDPTYAKVHLPSADEDVRK
jgi:5-hydroxyisourate hydrolase-like protein (transthyretin family)